MFSGTSADSFQGGIGEIISALSEVNGGQMGGGMPSMGGPRKMDEMQMSVGGDAQGGGRDPYQNYQAPNGQGDGGMLEMLMKMFGGGQQPPSQNYGPPV